MPKSTYTLSPSKRGEGKFPLILQTERASLPLSPSPYGERVEAELASRQFAPRVRGSHLFRSKKYKRAADDAR
jgi:hypothetical protein